MLEREISSADPVSRPLDAGRYTLVWLDALSQRACEGPQSADAVKGRSSLQESQFTGTARRPGSREEAPSFR